MFNQNSGVSRGCPLAGKKEVIPVGGGGKMCHNLGRDHGALRPGIHQCGKGGRLTLLFEIRHRNPYPQQNLVVGDVVCEGRHSS